MIVNLDELEALDVTGTINEAALRAHGMIRGNYDGIKVLGGGELKKKISVEADHVSASAREKIEAAGGSVTLASAAKARAKPEKPSKKAAAKA